MLKRLLLLLTLFFLTIPSISYSDGVVCTKPAIHGYEDAANRAKLYVSQTTRQIENTTIYIEKDVDGHFYYHSNYKSKDSGNPTKLAGSLNDAESAVHNIIFPGYNPPKSEFDLFLKKYKDVELILDESVFNKNGTSDFKFNQFSNIKVAKRGQRRLEETINYSKGWGQYELLVRAGRCCVYMKPRAPAKTIIRKLRQKKFIKNKTKFISLIKDTSTERAIENSKLPQVKLDMVADVSAQIEKQLSSMQGESLIILGHVERNNYVIRDSTGKSISQIPIQKLRETASKYKVQLVDIGCNTARLPSAGSGTVAVAAKFNSLHAVELINKAHSTSKNYEDFLFSISSKKLPIVIDSEIFKNVDVSTEVMVRSEFRDNYYEPIGTITMTIQANSITEQALEEEQFEYIELVDPNIESEPKNGYDFFGREKTGNPNKDDELERILRKLRQQGFFDPTE